MIRISSPKIGIRERAYVNDCLDRNELSGAAGRYVRKFEQEFARFTESAYCVTASSGTTALHLALIAAGIQPRTKVLVPALTYVATANAVTYCGALPIFCDVHPNTWCMDPEAVAEILKREKVSAILPVHLYGVTADMAMLGKLAANYNVFLIEDAAEAHGARWQDHPVGGVSDLGVFSFYANKLITAGEGGCVVTDNAGAVETMRLYRGQGATGKNFYHSVLGFNYRMTNIQAAIALAQLETLQERLDAHERVRQLYDAEALGISQERTAGDVTWLYSLLLPDDINRDDVIEFMFERGVETRPVFMPLTQLPVYAQSTPLNAAHIGRQGICLPTHSDLSEEAVSIVTNTLKEALYAQRHRSTIAAPTIGANA